MEQRYQIRPSNAARRRSTTCKVANMDGFFWFFSTTVKSICDQPTTSIVSSDSLLLNERKNKGKTWWDNDETLHDDTHLPRTPNPKRRICPDFSTNTLPIWSRQEAAIHLSFQYSCNECTYIKHDGLVLVLWVMEVAGMRWGEMWCCGRPRQKFTPISHWSRLSEVVLAGAGKINNRCLIFLVSCSGQNLAKTST